MATERAAALESGIDAFYGDSHVLHDVSFALGEGRAARPARPQRRRQDHLHERRSSAFSRRARGAIAVFGETIGAAAAGGDFAQGLGLVPQGRRVFRA